MTDKPRTSVIAVHYGRSFGPFGSEVVEVAREGVSTLSVDFNYDGNPEVGLWQHAMAVDKLDELVRRLSASGFDRGAWPVPPFPGAPYFGVRRAGENLPASHEFMYDQPELQDALAYLSEITGEIRRHPVLVLHGRAHWKNDTAFRGGEVDIEVVLSNAGPRPFALAHPAHPKSGAFVDSVIRRPTGGDHSVNAILDVAALPAAEGAPKAPALKLAPGESVTLLVHTKLTVGLGRHPARLRVNIDPARGQVAERFEGKTLELGLGPLVIEAPQS